MNKVLVGAAIGLAAVAGYFTAKMQDRNQFEKIGGDLKKYVARFKRDGKNVLDKGRNEAEYFADRAESLSRKGKEKLYNVGE